MIFSVSKSWFSFNCCLTKLKTCDLLINYIWLSTFVLFNICVFIFVIIIDVAMCLFNNVQVYLLLWLLFICVFICFCLHLIGCAFVTYASRQSALTAIQNMHHTLTMEVSLLVLSLYCCRNSFGCCLFFCQLFNSVH